MENKKWWLLPAILGGVSLVILVLFMVLFGIDSKNLSYQEASKL